jgi:hypothetical protein
MYVFRCFFKLCGNLFFACVATTTKITDILWTTLPRRDPFYLATLFEKRLALCIKNAATGLGVGDLIDGFTSFATHVLSPVIERRIIAQSFIKLKINSQ